MGSIADRMRARRWGFVKVLYDDEYTNADGFHMRGILALGGGTYWARRFDTVDDDDQPVLPSPDDEYDDGETLDYQFRQALISGQEPVLYANCLVPTALRHSSATPGWVGYALHGSPDQDNHQLVADYYARIVDYYYPCGLRKVVVGGEMRGMYAGDPGATVGLVDGWDVDRYWDLYERIYDAVKALRPDVQVYGPYQVFYNGDEYSEPNVTVGSTEIAEEALDAMTGFLSYAIDADKIDGVAFDAVLPATGWVDLINWIRQQAPGLPIVVAEEYLTYNSGGQQGDEIDSNLLQTINEMLTDGDLAFVWGEPLLWADATLVVPDNGAPLWPTGMALNDVVLGGIDVGAKNQHLFYSIPDEAFNVTFNGARVV